MIRFGVERGGALNAAQRDVFDRIVSGPRGKMSTPFYALLASPELADRVQEVGSFLRYHSKLPGALRELAIVAVASTMKSGVEYSAHSKIALSLGVSEKAIADASGGSHHGVDPLQCQIVEFAIALSEDACSEPPHAHALQKALGDEEFADLVCLCGYYRLLATFLRLSDLDHWSDRDGQVKVGQLIGQHD